LIPREGEGVELLPPKENMKKTDFESLEQLIDKYGIRQVIETMSQISLEKGDHVRTNWQDPYTANAWNRIAGLLSRVSQYKSLLRETEITCM
jgi:hypothetical protein